MATCKNFNTIGIEVDSEDFNCPLCFEVFEVPKSFPNCAHNLCKSCLSRLVENRKGIANVQCPICRKESPLPAQGVDGFPTNTFLVRCLEKIPGFAEKKKINGAVSRCKEEIERTKMLQEKLEKQLAVVNQNKKHGEELKKKISSHANESLQAIKKCEEKMCKEIDELLNRYCGLIFQKELERELERLVDYLEVGQNCVFNVEETIKNDDLKEISDMKEVFEIQLNEYSKYPESSILEDVKNVKTFDVTFEKNKIDNNFLGKLITDGQVVNMSNESCASETCHQRLPENRADAESLIADDNGSVFTCQILHTVDLSFCPTRIAVCSQSYDIAILCKEERKVLIYNANAEYRGVIKVMYGDLSDVGFSPLSNVVIINRESNRLLLYSKDGPFMRTKFQIPTGNLKYTYLSSHNDQLIVVSTQTDDDGDDDGDNEIVKCVVVHELNDTSSYDVFGGSQLNCPISRAVYHEGKFYIADMNRMNEVVIKAFSVSEFELVLEVPDISRIYPNPTTGFVSILSDNFSSWLNSFLYIGFPNRDHFDTFESHEYKGQRTILPAKQWETVPADAVRRDGNLDLEGEPVIQMEIYQSKKFLRVVQYDQIRYY